MLAPTGVQLNGINVRFLHRHISALSSTRSHLAFPYPLLPQQYTVMSASRQCYWPNNKPANGNYPCSNDEITACCGSSAICLSNGYCMDITQPFTLSRGGCTSDTWASGCPTACREYPASLFWPPNIDGAQNNPNSIIKARQLSI